MLWGQFQKFCVGTLLSVVHGASLPEDVSFIPSSLLLVENIAYFQGGHLIRSAVCL